jgi:aminoglycoside phosphotransferase (APT) family kinase protein
VTLTLPKNIVLANLPKIGEGATSEIYKLGSSKVIKLFKPEYSLEAVAYEASIAQTVNALPLSAPRCYGTLETSGRQGIVYEYVEGESLFTLLVSASGKAKKIVQDLAREQARLNSLECPSLPMQRDRFYYLISKTDLPPEQARPIVDFLFSIPITSRLCHGDFHVGNVFLRNDELVTLDWMNAYSGNPEGDCVRSWLMLASPFIPVKLSPFSGFRFLLFKKYLAHCYLSAYVELSGVKRSELRRWLAVVAAVRLADHVPGEEFWLKRIIRRNLRCLSPRL